MGWFDKNKGNANTLDFRTVGRMDRENFFYSIRQQGWVEVTGAFEFDKNWDVERIRKSARAYALKIGAEMLVEVKDPTYSSNPYNDLVFYVFKRGAQAPQQSSSGYGGNAWQAQQGQQQANQYPQGYPQGQWGQQQPGYPTTTNSYPANSQVQQTQAQQAGFSTPQQETAKKQKGRATELFLKSHYTTVPDAFVDCLSNISKMLCMEPCPLPFSDNKEFMGRSIVFARGAYDHMGVRKMDLVMVNPETDVYHIFGNEGHDPYARRVHYMRDELVVIKTEGLPRFDTLPDYTKLDDNQKAGIARALFSYLEHFLPKR